MQEYADKMKEALEKNHSLVFGARCQIWYSGRAESHLSEGDRIVLIKPDKTLLIHQPFGQNPVNYMKEGTSHHITSEDGLFLHSQNLALKEFMEMKISAVHFLNAHPLEDNHKILVSGSEKDMADMLYDHPHLIEQGFVPLSREEHTKYGFIDLFGYDKANNLVVIECKRYNADPAAVSQLRRYVEKIKSAKGVNYVRGILAAPKISKPAEQMLTDWGFEFCQIHPPKYLEKYEANQKRLDHF